jgi:uncharacterized protein YjbJ (UPF0337 family)
MQNGAAAPFSDNRWLLNPTDRKRVPGTMGSAVACRPFAGVLSRSRFMGINKDQVEGRVKEAAGKIQETAGKAVGNTKEQVKGNINKNVGAAQAGFGDAKSRINKDSK